MELCVKKISSLNVCLQLSIHDIVVVAAGMVEMLDQNLSGRANAELQVHSYLRRRLPTLMKPGRPPVPSSPSLLERQEHISSRFSFSAAVNIMH
jgi:hypothetical protein